MLSRFLPFALSHSAMDVFETCPRKFQAQYLTKEIKYEPSIHTDLGKSVHKMAEWYIASRDVKRDVVPLITSDEPDDMLIKRAMRSVNTTFPLEAATVKEHWLQLKKAMTTMPIGVSGITSYSEMKMAIDHTAAPVDYAAKTAVFRTIVDLLIVGGESAYMADFKTSKALKDNGQLRRSAVCVFAAFPKVKRVTMQYLSSRGLQPLTAVMGRHEAEDTLFLDIDLPSADIESAVKSGVFKPKSSGLCKDYCSVTACEYCGRGK